MRCDAVERLRPCDEGIHEALRNGIEDGPNKLFKDFAGELILQVELNAAGTFLANGQELKMPRQCLEGPLVQAHIYPAVGLVLISGGEALLNTLKGDDNLGQNRTVGLCLHG